MSLSPRPRMPRRTLLMNAPLRRSLVRMAPAPSSARAAFRLGLTTAVVAAASLSGSAGGNTATGPGGNSGSSTPNEIFLWISPDSGLFHSPSNWLPNAVPGSSDTSVFQIDSNYTVHAASSFTTGCGRVHQGQVTFDLSNNTWQLTQPDHEFIIGVEAGNEAAAHLVSGHFSLHALLLGHDPDAFGSLTIDGPASSLENSWGSLCLIGEYGTGHATVSNGGSTFIGLHTRIGYQPGSTGVLRAEGVDSTWTSGGDLLAGVAGTGYLEVADGAAVLAQNMFLGSTVDSFGSLLLSEPGSLAQSTFKLSVGFGFGASGEMRITSGARAESLFGIVGELDGAFGEVHIAGPDSIWDVDDALYVGFHGDGTMLVTEGGTVQSKFARVGRYSGSTAHAVIRDPNSGWINQQSLRAGVTPETDARVDLIDDATIIAETFIVGPWGLVHADGTIEANVLNTGTIVPARIHDSLQTSNPFSAGTLKIVGDYAQSDGENSGALHMRLHVDEPMLLPAVHDLFESLGSDSGELDLVALLESAAPKIASDLLTITGTASLDGELIVDIPSAAIFELDSCLTLIEAESINGNFSNISIGASEGLPELIVHISETMVQLCAGAPPDCSADLNGDGSVDALDLFILLQAWGPCEDPDDCAADIAGNDGVVNIEDLSVMLQQWGTCQ